MLKVVAVVGALVVIAGGILVYQFGSTAVASNRARTDSISLLESIRVRGNDADTQLRALPTFELSSTTPDFPKAKQTADQYFTQLGNDRTTIQTDEKSLRADEDRLASQASSVFALPFRSSLDHERVRADGMLSALQAADAGIGIEQDQMKAISALFDAEGSFYTLLTDHIEKQDYAGAIALFPTLDAKLKSAAQAATGSNMPPQLPRVITAMQTLSTDLNAFVVAVQQRNAATVRSLAAKVTSDANAFGTFDSNGLDSYEQTLLRPYEDRYDAGVRAAGFTPTTPTPTPTV